MSFCYVLKLTNENYYVGISSNIQNRLYQHFSNTGAKWTKKYPPIKAISIEPLIHPWQENFKTLCMMKKHGIVNVRGGDWCSSNIVPTVSKLHRIDLDKTIEENFVLYHKNSTEELDKSIEKTIAVLNKSKKIKVYDKELDELNIDIFKDDKINRHKENTQLLLSSNNIPEIHELNKMIINTIDKQIIEQKYISHLLSKNIYYDESLTIPKNKYNMWLLKKGDNNYYLSKYLLTTDNIYLGIFSGDDYYVMTICSMKIYGENNIKGFTLSHENLKKYHTYKEKLKSNMTLDDVRLIINQ